MPTRYCISCSCPNGPRIRYATGTNDPSSMECTGCHAKLEIVAEQPQPERSFYGRDILVAISRIYVKTGQAPQGLTGAREVKGLNERIATLEEEKRAVHQDWQRREEALLRRIKDLESVNSGLRLQISDCEKTVAHCRNEAERQKSVDFRGAMKEISDYLCDIYYAPDKKDSLEKLGAFIRDRTDIAMMNLEGRGIEVVPQSPGEKLSGPAEVIGNVPTTDWTLNNRVALVDSFGCRFRNDLFPPILGAVRIYSSGSSARGEPDASR